jgi:hypothetical protein
MIWFLMGCFAGEEIEPMAVNANNLVELSPATVDPCADAPVSWIGTPAVHHVCEGAVCTFPALPKPYSRDEISVLFHGAEQAVRCRTQSGEEQVLYTDKVPCPCGARNTQIARYALFSQ